MLLKCVIVAILRACENLAVHCGSALWQHPTDGYNPQHGQRLSTHRGQGYCPLPLHQDPRVLAHRPAAGLPGGTYQSCGYHHQGKQSFCDKVGGGFSKVETGCCIEKLLRLVQAHVFLMWEQDVCSSITVLFSHPLGNEREMHVRGSKTAT